MEHGLRAGRSDAARLCRRSGQDPHRGERPCARGARSHRARLKAPRLCRPSASARRRCGQSRRVQQRDRLARPHLQSEGRLSLSAPRTRTPPTTRTSAPSSGPTPRSASSKWLRIAGSTSPTSAAIYGVTILTDYKNGSDKPDDNTIRLTLAALARAFSRPQRGDRRLTPIKPTRTGDITRSSSAWQATRSDWREAQTDWQAYRLNDPLMPFATEAHAGALGKSFSLLQRRQSAHPRLGFEEGRGFATKSSSRAVEMDGKPASDVHFAFARTGCMPRAKSTDRSSRSAPQPSPSGKLVTSFHGLPAAYLRIEAGAATKANAAAVRSQPVTLPYDSRGGDQRRHEDAGRRL